MNSRLQKREVCLRRLDPVVGVVRGLSEVSIRKRVRIKFRASGFCKENRGEEKRSILDISGLVGFRKVWYTVNMTTITLEDMKRDLNGTLKRVSAGETLLIVEADQPLAELKPVPPVAQQLRPFGLCAGEFPVPEDFDAPLSDF
jgi:antitoxin (DNA-binding transcriptional repressor) of toxin-antitoxin stability system